MWRGRKGWKPQAEYSTKEEPFVEYEYEKFKMKHKSPTKSKEDETKRRFNKRKAGLFILTGRE